MESLKSEEQSSDDLRHARDVGSLDEEVRTKTNG
jgi:hypothetical protein